MRPFRLVSYFFGVPNTPTRGVPTRYFQVSGAPQPIIRFPCSLYSSSPRGTGQRDSTHYSTPHSSLSDCVRVRAAVRHTHPPQLPHLAALVSLACCVDTYLSLCCKQQQQQHSECEKYPGPAARSTNKLKHTTTTHHRRQPQPQPWCKQEQPQQQGHQDHRRRRWQP